MTGKTPTRGFPQGTLPDAGRALLEALLDARETGVLLAHVPPDEVAHLAGAVLRGLAASPWTPSARARVLLRLAAEVEVRA